MKRSVLTYILPASALLLLCGFAVQHTTKTSAKPNLLVILVDQWRGEALGFEKKEPVLTPALDKFAAQSFVAEQMVSNNPICSPARAMFFSGQYSFKNKVTGNANSRTAPDGIELQASTVCWSDVLKANGYANGYIGKWHLDAPHQPYIPTSNNTEKLAWNEWTPPARRHGFDYWYAYGTYDEHLRPMYWDNNADRDGFHYVDQWGPEHEAEKALSFLKNANSERDGNKPFSLVVSMNPPHSNYKQVPQRYIDLYKNISLDSLTKDPNIPAANTPMGKLYRENIKLYYAAITGVDEQIGKILQGLKELKLDDNTIVVFVADHGNCLGKHDQESKNTIYEEAMRIPLIVRWPGHITPRYDSVFLGNIPDLYPTILDLMGLARQTPREVDGKSYASYFLNGKGDKPAAQFLLGTINTHSPNSGFRGIRTTDYKLAYVKEKGVVVPFLFDLKKDPFELKNIYEERSPLVQSMTKQLAAWLQQNNDPFTIK